MFVLLDVIMIKLIVKKPWGKFIQYTHNEKTTVKIIEVRPSGILSLQSHKKRKEFWAILEGNPVVTVGSMKMKLKKGDEVEIAKGKKHRIENHSKSLVRFLEISFGSFDENDIKRYEDKYGRI